MAVLFDSFSYRIKEVESGICYDRWHFGKYPELTMPEHLYYLNRVINCLLTHDKIIIRTDSLEEIIDVLGFEAFRLLYERQELVIIDNWWFPAFMIGNENLLFMNMHKSNYYDKVIERINNKYGFQASLFIKQVFEKVTSDSESEEYVYWDHIAQENMYEDFTINNQIRTYLNIESENILDINEKDTWSAVRWGLVSVTGLILPAVGGLAVSLLNEKIPSFSQKIPNIFFDHVLSQVFNTRKNRNALLALK